MFPDELIKACGRWSGFMPSRVGRLRRPSLMNERTASKSTLEVHRGNSDFTWTKECLRSPSALLEIGSKNDFGLHDVKSPGKQLLTGKRSQKNHKWSLFVQIYTDMLYSWYSICLSCLCIYITSNVCLRRFPQPPHPLCLLVLSFPLCVDWALVGPDLQGLARCPVKCLSGLLPCCRSSPERCPLPCSGTVISELLSSLAPRKDSGHFSVQQLL